MSRVLILFAFVLASSARADDVIHVQYPPSTNDGELACTANYYLWLPPGVATLRGVVVHQHGCGDPAALGGVSAARDLHWRELARKHDCALLGTSYQGADKNCTAWSNPRNGSRVRFHQALADLATKTQHPELKDAPWCLWGHSGGGWWASTMLVLEPERTVAVWLRSGTLFGDREVPGGGTRPEVPPAALKVPVMCNPGKMEKGDQRFNGAYVDSQTMFRKWRAKGAFIGFAADPLTGHDCGSSRYLAIPFFDACLTARLPAKPGALKPFDESAAWLGPVDGGDVKPLATFGGKRTENVWLPSEAVAKAWAEYVRTGNVADATPPPAPTDVKVAVEGRATVLTWDARADLESGLKSFLIERDGAVVTELPKKLKGQGNRGIFQGLSYHDTPDQPAVPFRFVDDAGKPGDRHTYRVFAVNTAGLKSAPSVAVESR